MDRAIAVVAEDAVYALHLSDDLLPTGGETIGRANIELRKVCRQFDYLLYGRFGMIMQVERGPIVRAEEYHDRAKVEAFLRHFAQ